MVSTGNQIRLPCLGSLQTSNQSKVSSKLLLTLKIITLISSYGKKYMLESKGNYIYYIILYLLLYFS